MPYAKSLKKCWNESKETTSHHLRLVRPISLLAVTAFKYLLDLEPETERAYSLEQHPLAGTEINELAKTSESSDQRDREIDATVVFFRDELEQFRPE